MKTSHLFSLFSVGMAATLAALLAASDPGQSILDGSDPNADGYIRAIAVQAEGRSLIGGGGFTTVGASARANLARPNVNGSVDDSFNLETDFPFYSVVVQADSRILGGGEFTILGGQPRDNIGRLTSGDAAIQRPALNFSVAAGVPPAVEGDVPPPGPGRGLFRGSGEAALNPPGGTPGSTTGETPAATTLNTYRGLAANGEANGSSGLIESVAPFNRVSQPLLIPLPLLGNGAFRFIFENPDNDPFTVIATTNVTLSSSNWTVLGSPTPFGGGFYQFIDPEAVSIPWRFYQLRWP